MDGRPTNVVTLTCASCEATLSQVVGSRRTICPRCGSFFDPAVAAAAGLVNQSRTTQRRRETSPEKTKDRLPSLADNDRKSQKPNGGRLQTIAKFFNNLNPGRRTSDNQDASTLPHLAPPNESRTSSGQLPSISPHPSGKLTIDAKTPSPKPPSTNTEMPPATFAVGSLRSEVEQAAESGSWSRVRDFYASVFSSFQQLNKTFQGSQGKTSRFSEDCDINFENVATVYSVLEKLPQELQKMVLKANINSLLKDRKQHSKSDLHAYLILLLNPQFMNTATYVILAHLLRQIAALSDHQHRTLVHWFTKLDVNLFRALVEKLHNFVSCRLFPPKHEDLPPMTKCSWWIPSATKVLALLNGANNACKPPLISHMEFYNSTLDHIDIMAEYHAWQNPTSHPSFSFCQYPFVLSIALKRNVLQRDSEHQMIIMARRSLVAKVQRREMPELGMLFLNLSVRRTHLVSDSLNQIANKQHDLKKKLKVTFCGEPGLDMGGLTKEWFLLLIRQIFQPEYGMFTYNSKSRMFWFSSAPCENYQEFNLVGVLMGLAVYNSIILDIHFPHICYKKLLSPAVVPYNDPTAPVGIARPVTLDDLQPVMPELASSLQQLLDYEGNVEEDFGVTFQTSYSEFDRTVSVPLKADGENIAVTNSNRKEYVQLYVEYILNVSITPQFRAFYHGFHSVCASNALIMLRPEEVELLVCGCPTLDMGELKKVTTYDGYTQHDTPVKHFWECVAAMSRDMQKRLLLFATGSDRIPIGGMAEMQLKITRVDNTDMLPMSHTCFNHIILPAYRSKKTLNKKLLIAIQNAEGFGLE